MRGIPHWWELSVDDLYGEMLVRMSWYQILNRRRNMKIHLILTEEHQQLPIIKNQAVLKLVGKTDNFIPTPSAQQLIRNVSQSLNIFSVRVYNQCSGFIHRNRIEESRLAAEAAGIPPWKPKTFNHNQTWYANRIAFVFSRQNTADKILHWIKISDCVQNYRKFWALFNKKSKSKHKPYAKL